MVSHESSKNNNICGAPWRYPRDVRKPSGISLIHVVVSALFKLKFPIDILRIRNDLEFPVGIIIRSSLLNNILLQAS